MVHVAQDVVFRQVFEKLRRVGQAAEALVLLKGQLIGGALDVGGQDIQVIGLHQRVLRRGAEEIVRVLDHILVQRGGGGHQNGQRRILAPSGAARLLPGAGDGAGIAAQHARREGTDVDAQLQRVGGHDHIHLARPQAALDFAPL